MLQDRARFAVVIVLLLGLIFAVVYSLRASDRPQPSPTVNIPAVQTQAVATFAGGLTATAAAQPSSTATETLAAGSPTAGTETSALSPTPSCYRLKYVRDVTIPDNTPMTPAEVFTKTWEVENVGTCEWRPGFKLVLIGGVAMGGSPFVLESTVNPGGRIKVSVKMVAPTNQTGIVQGTWRMTDDVGTPFGDALTVIIVVGSGTGAAPTVAPASATP